jgi:hypothetical protein
MKEPGDIPVCAHVVRDRLKIGTQGLGSFGVLTPLLEHSSNLDFGWYLREKGVRLPQDRTHDGEERDEDEADIGCSHGDPFSRWTLEGRKRIGRYDRITLPDRRPARASPSEG